MKLLLVIFGAVLLSSLVYLFLNYIKFSPFCSGWLCCSAYIGFITYFKKYL
jgi:hypothetical protein